MDDKIIAVVKYSFQKPETVAENCRRQYRRRGLAEY